MFWVSLGDFLTGNISILDVRLIEQNLTIILYVNRSKIPVENLLG